MIQCENLLIEKSQVLLRRSIEQNIIIDQNKNYIKYFSLDGYCRNIEPLLLRIRESKLLQQLSQLLYEFDSILKPNNSFKAIRYLHHEIIINP